MYLDIEPLTYLSYIKLTRPHLGIAEQFAETSERLHARCRHRGIRGQIEELQKKHQTSDSTVFVYQVGMLGLLVSS